MRYQIHVSAACQEKAFAYQCTIGQAVLNLQKAVSKYMLAAPGDEESLLHSVQLRKDWLISIVVSWCAKRIPAMGQSVMDRNDELRPVKQPVWDKVTAFIRSGVWEDFVVSFDVP